MELKKLIKDICYNLIKERLNKKHQQDTLTCTKAIVINKSIGHQSFVFMFYITSSTMICCSSFISQSNYLIFMWVKHDLAQHNH